jgi:hypothetical protein
VHAAIHALAHELAGGRIARAAFVLVLFEHKIIT